MSSTSIFNKVFRWLAGKQTALSAQAVNAIGTEIDVSQFKNIGMTIITTGLSGTIKVPATFEETSGIDFTLAASGSNPWANVGFYNYDSGAFNAGSTGAVFVADTGVYHYTINTDEIHTLTAALSNRTAGSVTVYFYPANNQ